MRCLKARQPTAASAVKLRSRKTMEKAQCSYRTSSLPGKQTSCPSVWGNHACRACRARPASSSCRFGRLTTIVSSLSVLRQASTLPQLPRIFATSLIWMRISLWHGFGYRGRSWRRQFARRMERRKPAAWPALCSELYKPQSFTIADHESAFDLRAWCTTCVLGALLSGMLSGPELVGRWWPCCVARGRRYAIGQCYRDRHTGCWHCANRYGANP